MQNSDLAALLSDIETKANDAIDKLISRRQAAPNGEKQQLSYITKKLEVIVGACHRAQDKLPVEFKL